MLETIKQTKQIDSVKSFNITASGTLEAGINAYLDLGWVIIGTWTTDRGELGASDQTFHVLLGWQKEECPAPHPKAPQSEFKSYNEAGAARWRSDKGEPEDAAENTQK